jgi:hypothetical protein
MRNITAHDKYDELERDIEYEEELERYYEMIGVSSQDVTPFTEMLGLDLSKKGADPVDKGSSYLATMLEHILKLFFCTSTRAENDWLGTIRRCQAGVHDIIGWDHKKINRNIKRKIDARIDKIFDNAVEGYKAAMKKHQDDLPDIVKDLPPRCPWSFNQLMEANFDQDDGSSKKHFYERNRSMKEMRVELMLVMKNPDWKRVR